MSISVGDIVARGSRSTVHRYGHGAVVKVPDRQTPEQWILAEARYSETVRVAGAPVPRLLGIEKLSARAASVWEYVPGPSLWTVVFTDPQRLAEHAKMLADVHAAVLQLTPPIGIPRQQDRLRSKIRHAARIAEPDMIRALEHVRPAGAARVCHGDLHPANVIVSPSGPVLVDWFDVSLGDPAGDLARSALLLSAAGSRHPAHLPDDRSMVQAFAREYLPRVEHALGVRADEVRRWRAVQAVARIAEGVERAPLIAEWHAYRGG